MKKHEHKWQFVREVNVDMFSQVAWNLKSGPHLKFVCSCGAVKYVTAYEVKNGRE
jgi:hypothetical protein